MTNGSLLFSFTTLAIEIKLVQRKIGFKMNGIQN